jgi:hypothetical protein
MFYESNIIIPNNAESRFHALLGYFSHSAKTSKKKKLEVENRINLECFMVDVQVYLVRFEKTLHPATTPPGDAISHNITNLTSPDRRRSPLSAEHFCDQKSPQKWRLLHKIAAYP